VPLPSHSGKLCDAGLKPGHVRSALRFKSSLLDLSLHEIEKLIEEVTANDKQLEEGKAEQAQTISPVFVMHSKEPSRRPKKHSLPTGACKHLKRILAGQESMGEMNNALIDCLNHVREIEGHYLTWNHYEDDIPNPVNNKLTCPKYCVIHPSGDLHERHAANPKLDNRCYAFHIKKRNNLKRMQHKMLISKTWESHKQDGNQ